MRRYAVAVTAKAERRVSPPESGRLRIEVEHELVRMWTQPRRIALAGALVREPRVHHVVDIEFPVQCGAPVGARAPALTRHIENGGISSSLEREGLFAARRRDADQRLAATSLWSIA